MKGHAHLVVEFVVLVLLGCSVTVSSRALLAERGVERKDPMTMIEFSRASLRQAAKVYSKSGLPKTEDKHGDKENVNTADKHDRTKNDGKTEPSSKSGGKQDGMGVKELQARTQMAEAKAAEAKARLKKIDSSYEHANGKLQENEHTIQSLSEMLEKLHEENEQTLKEREGMQNKLSSAEEEMQQLRDMLKAKEKEAKTLAMSNNKTGSSLESMQQRLERMRQDRDKLKQKLVNSTTDSAQLRRSINERTREAMQKGQKQQAEAVVSLNRLVEQMKNESASLKAKLAEANLEKHLNDHTKMESALFEQTESVRQAASEVDALGSSASLEKKQSMVALQRQMRKAVSFAAALKQKLDHGANVLKKAIVQSKQLGGMADSDS
eukprot:CAMPEP_0118940368 /NCGR_PEP_ID=MMETSP1169-20130426/31298_1 /TAXON_ID=36882 /ORGANISM="Pyramimonas obovata, Strain CCMP722" /LENGTH=379 /DNA_ID=CAMNT_0006884839 /DNA_START=144 /DNA_END=1280 /DNA_ORIENTATION=+